MKLKDVKKEGWYYSVENPTEMFCVMETSFFESLDTEEEYCFDIWTYLETKNGIKHYECQDGMLHFFSYEEADVEVMPLNKEFETYGNGGCFCHEVKKD